MFFLCLRAVYVRAFRRAGRSHLAPTQAPTQAHPTVLLSIVCSGRVDLAKLLIGASADINKAAGVGGRPLMVACYRGHTPMVRLLLDHGAEATEPRAGGGTPLISAACMGHADCVRLLLDEGVPLNEQFEGLTALGWAQRQKHRACVRLLEGPTYAGASAGEAGGAGGVDSAKAATTPPAAATTEPVRESAPAENGAKGGGGKGAKAEEGKPKEEKSKPKEKSKSKAKGGDKGKGSVSSSPSAPVAPAAADAASESAASSSKQGDSAPPSPLKSEPQTEAPASEGVAEEVILGEAADDSGMRQRRAAQGMTTQAEDEPSRDFFVVEQKTTTWTREHTILACLAAGALLMSGLVVYAVKSATESKLEQAGE